jgi:hypothetical protein
MGEFVVKTYALPQTGEVHSIANYEDKSSFRDIVDEIWHKVLATEDKQIQEALIKLGWTPPVPEKLNENQVNDDFCYWSHYVEMKDYAVKLNMALKTFFSAICLSEPQIGDVQNILFEGICKDCLRWDLKDGQCCHCRNDE